MSDQLIVIGSFAIVYGSALAYAVYLHRRNKRAEG